MKTTLVIMAAGIGSRYGNGIKQLAAVDSRGHIIIDFSIHDAIDAGFNKLVFVIRRDIEADFREVIGNRIEKYCAERGVEVGYAFQDLHVIPGAFPEGRSKPWGTGQAVLAAREEVSTPFAVINADDYYGTAAFYSLHEYLCREHAGNEYAMAGFILKNTLSENGGVTRGICSASDDGYLTDVVETSNIMKTPTGASVDGTEVNADGYVSMNMWALPVAFMDTLEENFKKFFEQTVPGNPMKAEYLLPVLIGRLLEEKKCTVKILPTPDRWLGITYAEDLPYVKEELAKTRELMD